MNAAPEAYARIGSAGASTFSTDGGTLWHLRGTLAQIWALDPSTGASRQVTQHDEKVAFLRRAPADDRIVYGIDAGGDERQQLHLLLDGRSAPMTENPAANHDFGAWSPDGTHVAYAANDRDEAQMDVLVRAIAAEDGAVQRFLEGPEVGSTGQLAVAGYSPDGRRLAVILDRSFGDQGLVLVDLVGGGRHLVPSDGATRLQSVRWAADGRMLLCLTDAGGRDFLALCRLDPETGSTDPVFEAAGRDVEAWSLAPDKSTLATIENDQGYAVLRIGPMDGDRPVVEGLPRGVVSDLAWSPDSARLAFCAASPTEPAALFLWERATGAVRRLWAPDPRAEAGIDPASFRPFELVEWESFDGRRIPGWFALPAGKKPAAGWPAVIWVHGGPASQTRANFRADMQMLLAQGYAVLMPNVRGSTGYGRAYTLSDERERRLDSVTDLAHGRHWLAAHPEVDAERIGVMGQSYGGYMVLAAITEHPELWRVAVNYYGIADFTTLLQTTGPWRRSHRADEYGDPETHAELFARISPIRNIERARAPLLVLHGTRDPRVPITESEQFVTALRLRQHPVRYEVFDYAGHGFIRPDDRVRVFGAVAAQFRDHL